MTHYKPSTQIKVDGLERKVSEHCKSRGLAVKTVTGRLNRGWEIQRAFSLVPHSGNKALDKSVASSGHEMREGIRDSFLKIWREQGQQQFEIALRQAFHDDPIGTVERLYKYLPKDLQHETKNINAAVVRIELSDTRPPVTYEQRGFDE